MPSADAVQTVAANLTTPFSESQQTLSLSANVSDKTIPSTTVSAGTVTFTVKDGNGATVGTAVQGTVSNGKATANFTLPSDEVPGNYSIAVSYSDSAGNFSDGGDTPGKLTVSVAPTTTAASNATAAFSTTDQNVTLNATVTSTAGTVNEGSVTFTILQGTTVIGTAVSGPVSTGSASATYVLPGTTDAGSYTILAAYSDNSGNFAASSDNTHTLSVTSATAAATTTTASNASASFSPNAQNVTLNATVTSSAGTVNKGTVTFTILQGSTVIGTATPGPVSAGAASVSYALPNGTVPGSYTIEANYTDPTGAFAISSDTSHTLTVSAASTTTAASSTTTAFSTNAQNVTLGASVTSSGGVVNEGNVSFTIVDSNGNTIGTATSGAVHNGSTSVSFALPAGTVQGTYTIKAAYSDSSGNFAASSDNTHTLAVNSAPTTTTATNASISFSSSAQNVTLNATVTSSGGIVNEGSVTFFILDSNGNTIGTTTTGPVSNGSASVSFALPAGTAAGSYSITANYTDSSRNFAASFDSSHTLSVNASNATSLSLTTIRITPNVAGGTAQVTLTAQVSNPGGTISQGIVSFTLAGVSGQANVQNGSATVQLTVPIQNVLNGFTVDLAYTDNATAANFANNNASQSLSTNVWNALLPATLTFDSSGNEQIQFTVGSMSLFGAAYAQSTGLLSQVSVGSLSVPMSYTNLGNLEFASLGGVPWGMILHDSNGNLQGIADVETAADGSLVWVFYNSNHQRLGDTPYGG